MQLACIVNMVPAWKRLKLRICLCEEPELSNRFTVSDGFNNSENRAAEHKLRQLLQLLRITASIYQIPMWSEVIDQLGGRAVAYRTDPVENGDDLNKNYISRYENCSKCSSLVETIFVSASTILLGSTRKAQPLRSSTCRRLRTSTMRNPPPFTRNT